MRKSIKIAAGLVGAVALIGVPVSSLAQQKSAVAAPPAPVAPAAPARSYLPRVPLQPPRTHPSFYQETVTHVFTRDASYGHSRIVDLANAASILVDRGECAKAQNYLDTMGAHDMAARVPAVCDAKRRGVI